MGDYWFASLPTEKSIKIDGGRFKGIVKAAHDPFAKTELKNMMETFQGGTYGMMESVGRNGQKIYAIGYNYSKKFICFIVSEETGEKIPGKPYEDRWTDLYGDVH